MNDGGRPNLKVYSQCLGSLQVHLRNENMVALDKITPVLCQFHTQCSFIAVIDEDN